MVSLSGQGFWTTGRWRWLGESKGEDLSKRDSNLARCYTPTLQDGFARIVRKVRLLEKHLARQKVLRDDFVHRGREVDLRGRASAATKHGTLQDVRKVRLVEKTSS